MKKLIFYGYLFLGANLFSFLSVLPKKIVALLPARNESLFIEQCLRALAMYTDAIVYLDDASTDNSVEIVESLTTECNIEKIIKKESWYRDEPGDRNRLLQAGREIGGTHFIVLDADEMFTANCSQGNFLREKILELKPGERLAMTWIQLWRSTDNYRSDGSLWTNYYRDFIFCDDGRCAYDSAFIHTPRIPKNLSGNFHYIHGYTHGVMHFQFANWRNLLIKQAWYRCLEHIRQPEKSIREINQTYAQSCDETGLGLKKAPSEWFTNYHFFDSSVWSKPELWRERQVLDWFDEYGRSFFNELDIWNIDWGTFRNEEPPKFYSQSGQDQYVYEKYFKNKRNGFFVDIGAHDGITFSNTYFFERYLDWKGICIEPIPEVFKELSKNRQCTCIQGCISDTCEPAQFMHIKGYSEMLSGLMNKYDERHKRRIDNEVNYYGGQKVLLTVQCYKLNEILDNHGISHIDYLSLDTEGGELEILKSIDFNSVTIEIIDVENNYNDPEIANFLYQKGYRFDTRLGAEDELYVLDHH